MVFSQPVYQNPIWLLEELEAVNVTVKWNNFEFVEQDLEYPAYTWNITNSTEHTIDF